AQFARRLAESGFRVVVPVPVDRSDRWSGNDRTGWTNQPHREWLYRQAYHLGRHVLGYEGQKGLAVVDWLRRGAGGRGAGGGGRLRRGRAGGLLRGGAGAADRRLPGERRLRRPAAALGGADLPQRLGAAARVRRRGDRHADRTPRPGGRVQRGAGRGGTAAG